MKLFVIHQREKIVVHKMMLVPSGENWEPWLWAEKLGRDLSKLEMLVSFPFSESKRVTMYSPSWLNSTPAELDAIVVRMIPCYEDKLVVVNICFINLISCNLLNLLEQCEKLNNLLREQSSDLDSLGDKK